MNSVQMFRYMKENPPLVQQYLIKYGMPSPNNFVTEYDLLFAAMDNGQEEIMKLMLSKGCSVSGCPTNTPLHAAIQMKNINFVRLLLQHGAPTEGTINDGQTPLHYGVMSRQKGIVLLLLQHGANWQATDDFGKTLLHLAIEDNTNGWSQNIVSLQRHHDNHARPALGKCGTSQEIMELLHIFFAKGIHIDSKTKSGQTPLHFAVKRQNKKIVQFLIDRHADIRLTDDNGDSPLHIAVLNKMQKLSDSRNPDHNYNKTNGEKNQSGKEKEQEKVKFVEWLLSLGADCDGANKNHETPFLLAMKTNQRLLAKTLLKYPINFNVCDENGRSILHFLLEGSVSSSKYEEDTYEFVKILLEKGTDPNFADKKGRTPLHIAIKNKQIRVIGVLLPHSSNFDASDEDGNTILHLIPSILTENVEGFDDFVNNFSSSKVNVNMKNKENITPLQLAAKYKRKKMSELLLEHGADVHVITDNGENLLHLMSLTKCTKNKDDEKSLIRFLVRRGCQIDAVTKYGLTPLHLASCECIAEALIEHGADVHVKEKTTLKTPLHLAAQNNRKGVTELLLGAGADVNGRQLDGKSALHLAVQHQNIKILNSLLTHGADTELPDDNGRTPLHDACSYGKLCCIEYLLEFGADINAQDITSNTPLHYVNKKVKEVRSRLLYHIAKLDAANLDMDVYNYDRVKRVKSQLEEFYVRCSREIEKLKNVIVDQNKSMFDVLHMDLDDLAEFKKNVRFRNILLDIDFKEKYPIYEDSIIACYRKGIVRSGLVETAQESLRQLTNNDLPYSCIKSIFKYLKNGNLRALVEADSVKFRKNRSQSDSSSLPKRLKMN